MLFSQAIAINICTEFWMFSTTEQQWNFYKTSFQKKCQIDELTV